MSDKLSRSDLNKIKSMIRKELKSFKKDSDKSVDSKIKDYSKKDLETDVDKILNKNYKEALNLDKKLDDKVHSIFIDLMNKYHEIFYRDNNLIKNRLRK
jgi:hypothetical protein